MDRRQFCRSTVAASVVTAYPFLAACERPAPVATRAETAITGISLSGAEIGIEKAAIRELGDSLSGTVLVSGHPQYDTARKIWNGMHDKRPALIARCESAEDVSNAVTFANERELLVAVRGGGHSWPGHSVCDGGIMIDLSPMNTVQIDAERQRARAQGGALLSALDGAARQHELITTAGVVSHTGVGGFTLGGGFGRLNRKLGLTIDNLEAAEIVTADGRIRTVNAEREPDLFWAIRGGGGNFGVVTQFEYALHPFPLKSYLGVVIWPIEQAREVLSFYGDWYDTLSDEMYVAPIMLTTPDNQGLLVVEVVYYGDPSLGEKEAAPLFQVGKPLDNSVGLNDYLAFQSKDDAAFGHGIRSYAKSGMVREITPALIEAMVEAYVPDPRLAFFTHTAGGAVRRVDELATAFPHRNVETMLVSAAAWTDPAQDSEVVAASRQWYAQLEPHTGGYYENIQFDGESAGSNFGPAFLRLAEIKGRYDPMNLFRLNSNIQPAA